MNTRWRRSQVDELRFAQQRCAFPFPQPETPWEGFLVPSNTMRQNSIIVYANVQVYHCSFLDITHSVRTSVCLSVYLSSHSQFNILCCVSRPIHQGDLRVSKFNCVIDSGLQFTRSPKLLGRNIWSLHWWRVFRSQMFYMRGCDPDTNLHPTTDQTYPYTIIIII